MRAGRKPGGGDARGPGAWVSAAWSAGSLGWSLGLSAMESGVAASAGEPRDSSGEAPDMRLQIAFLRRQASSCEGGRAERVRRLSWWAEIAGRACGLLET